MAQCSENCEHKAKSDKRISLLADRLAISLVVLKQRYGSDWLPWFKEDCWDAADSLGDEIRAWPDYKVAKEMVKLFITRMEKADAVEMAEKKKQEERAKQRLESSSSSGAEATAAAGGGSGAG